MGALLICIAIIVGLVAMVNYGEKEKRIRIHGYDWKKPDNQRTQAEKDFILKKRQEEAIMKEFDIIQQGLKYREHKLRIYIAEHGMTEQAVNELSVDIMSLDAFQEYANRLSSHLRSELMNAAKGEALASARRRAAKNSFNGFDEIKEINNHKEAFANLFNVLNKCREYENKTNITTSYTGNATENYNSFNDDII